MSDNIQPVLHIVPASKNNREFLYFVVIDDCQLGPWIGYEGCSTKETFQEEHRLHISGEKTYEGRVVSIGLGRSFVVYTPSNNKNDQLGAPAWTGWRTEKAKA